MSLTTSERAAQGSSGELAGPERPRIYLMRPDFPLRQNKGVCGTTVCAERFGCIAARKDAVEKKIRRCLELQPFVKLRPIPLQSKQPVSADAFLHTQIAGNKWRLAALLGYPWHCTCPATGAAIIYNQAKLHIQVHLGKYIWITHYGCFGFAPTFSRRAWKIMPPASG